MTLVPAAALVIGILLGIACGALFPKLLARRAADRSHAPAPMLDAVISADPFPRSPIIYSGRLKLQCDCGHVDVLSDADGFDLPSGDSVACPDCGKVHNIARIRNMIGEATAGF